MKNAVTIKVKDRTKELTVGETLTTGSRYAVTVEGGATVCGADAALILQTREGVQVAVAALADGAGTLDLMCDAAMRLETLVPFGTILTLDAVLRCFDEGCEQNVAVGRALVIAAHEGEPNPATGTVVYWKGPKGDTGDALTWDTMSADDKAALVALVAAQRPDARELLSGDQAFQTSTLAGMRAALDAVIRALGGTLAALLIAVLPARAASVYRAPLGRLDLDRNPLVVTNVTFEGLTRPADLANFVTKAVTNGLASKADIPNAYSKTTTDQRISNATNALASNLGARLVAATNAIPRTSLAPATNYTDQAIARLPKALTTNDVCNIVTNEVDDFVWYLTDDIHDVFTISELRWSDLVPGDVTWGTANFVMTAFGATNSVSVIVGSDSRIEVGGHQFAMMIPVALHGPDQWVIWDLTSAKGVTFDYRIGELKNALGLARLSDLVAATNGLAVEESDPVWEADRPGIKASLAAISNEAQVVYRLYAGSNVLDVVTNYNSQTRMPTRKLYQLTETNDYVLVWDEERRHNNTLSNANEYANSLGTNYAPRAWSRTTSGLGAEAPEGTTWLSSPMTVIAGGYEYEKHVTSGGAIWLLTSNGSTFDFSPNTNNVAFLNIAATDGTPIFRIEKMDSYLIGVNASGVSTEEPSTLIVELDVVASDHPLVRVCSNIRDRDWQKEEDGISSSLATVTWSGSSGAWICRVQNNTGGNSIFAYFEYLQEGGVKIVNEGQVDLSQGIIVNGVKFAPTISGSSQNRTLTWTEVQ